eukprot:2271928-Rhodomonas_salina.1
MLEILGGDVDDRTRGKLLMPYVKYAPQCVLECFTDSEIFNEVAQRWNSTPNWPDLARLLHALLPDDSPPPTDSKLPFKSHPA